MNKEKLEVILRDFYTISGMEISVLDANFHTVSVVRCPEGNLCSYIHRTPSATEMCKNSDIEHLSLAESLTEPILYTCPCGISEAIVPVVRGDRIIAFVFASMGIIKSNLDDAKLAVLEAVPELDGERVSILANKMKILTPDEANAYFNMLKMIGEHIANDSTLTESNESIGTLVKYYVKNNLTRKLSLADIAWNLHCSTVTLTEHFKAEFGITIMEYVTKKRMALAEKLLLSTDEPLREIALATGFSDVEYFSRTFKRFHDKSPAAWRRSNKTNFS